jgi:hypothetical protein
VRCGSGKKSDELKSDEHSTIVRSILQVANRQRNLDGLKPSRFVEPIGWLDARGKNFIGFASDTRSRSLLRATVSAFRKTGKLPCEGAALPAAIPGIGWSDQWSFWQCGYPAIMVTDTAPFRYPHYHEPTDTPDKLDYDRFALVVSGMESVISELAK